MSNLIKKLTSRKFLLAVVGVAAGLAMAFGVTGDEITHAITDVAGIVTALVSAVTYIMAEAKIDAAAVTQKNDVEIATAPLEPRNDS